MFSWSAASQECTFLFNKKSTIVNFCWNWIATFRMFRVSKGVQLQEDWYAVIPLLSNWLSKVFFQFFSIIFHPLGIAISHLLEVCHQVRNTVSCRIPGGFDEHVTSLTRPKTCAVFCSFVLHYRTGPIRPLARTLLLLMVLCPDRRTGGGQSTSGICDHFPRGAAQSCLMLFVVCVYYLFWLYLYSLPYRVLLFGEQPGSVGMLKS